MWHLRLMPMERTLRFQGPGDVCSEAAQSRRKRDPREARQYALISIVKPFRAV
jgi:hypothetical protein